MKKCSGDYIHDSKTAAAVQGRFLTVAPVRAHFLHQGPGPDLDNSQKTGGSMLVPSPKWLDTGNNAWQLAAATFVGLQSIPGLMVLYGGVVKKKWAINSAFMTLYAFASVLVVWILFDYNMAFGPQWFSFLGK